jgi:hypothetical protein
MSKIFFVRILKWKTRWIFFKKACLVALIYANFRPLSFSVFFTQKIHYCKIFYWFKFNNVEKQFQTLSTLTTLFTPIKYPTQYLITFQHPLFNQALSRTRTEKLQKEGGGTVVGRTQTIKWKPGWNGTRGLADNSRSDGQITSAKSTLPLVHLRRLPSANFCGLKRDDWSE